VPMLVRLLAVALALAGVTAARAADPQTDDQKAFYALGYNLARQLGNLGLTEPELDFVKQGLTDGALGKPKKIDVDAMGPKLQEIAKARMASAADAEKKKGKDALDKAAAEKGAVKLDSGVVYLETQPGKGESPKATDKVKVHYKGTLLDGTEFDSSYKRNQPAEFPLNGVIKCWTEGVQKMKVGGKAKLVCPSDTAYGDRGAPPNIKPGATLVFEVELLDIVK